MVRNATLRLHNSHKSPGRGQEFTFTLPGTPGFIRVRRRILRLGIGPIVVVCGVALLLSVHDAVGSRCQSEHVVQTRHPALLSYLIVVRRVAPPPFFAQAGPQKRGVRPDPGRHRDAAHAGGPHRAAGQARKHAGENSHQHWARPSWPTVSTLISRSSFQIV